MELTLRHLTMLCAIEDEGSIGKAASRLGVSQPALTAQLRRIETALGHDVFHRSPAGVTVTRVGRKTLTTARATLASMERLLEGANALDASEETVRIGGHGPLLLALIDRLVGSAGVEMFVTVRAEKSAQLLQIELEQDKIDFALIREYPGREVPLGTGIGEFELVGCEPLFVGMSSTHPLARRQVVNLRDLADESWVLDPDDDTGENEMWLECCRHAGFEPRIGLSSSDNGVSRSYIGAGRAVGLCEARAAQDHELVVRPLKGDPITCRLALRWREDREVALTPKDVIEALCAVYEEAVQSRPVYRKWREQRSSDC